MLNSLRPHGLQPARLLSTWFSRQEFWSGLPFSTPGDLPDPGIEPATLPSPAWAGGFFPTSATWEALVAVVCGLICSAACGTLVPRPGMGALFPALQCGLLTTGPPGKPGRHILSGKTALETAAMTQIQILAYSTKQLTKFELLHVWNLI